MKIGLDTLEIIVFTVLAVAPGILTLSSKHRDAAVSLYLSIIPVYLFQKSWSLQAPYLMEGLTWPPVIRDLVSVIVAASLIPSVRIMPRVRSLTFFTAALPAVVVINSFARSAPVSQTLAALRIYGLYPIVGLLVGLYISSWSTHRLERLSAALIKSGLVVNLIALSHVISGSNLLIPSFMRQYYNGRPTAWQVMSPRLRSFMPNPNVLAYFSVFIILVAIAMIFRQRYKEQAVIALVSSGIVLLFTGSRSAWLSLLIVGFVIVVATRRSGAMLSFLLSLAFVPLAGLALAPELLERFQIGGDNPRLHIWQAHVADVSSGLMPLLVGRGPASNYRFAGVVQDAGVQVAGLDQFGINATDSVFYIDNVFVQAFFELGVFGLAFGAGLVFFALRCARTVRGRSGQTDIPLWLPLLPSCVLFWSMFSAAALTYPWNLLTWVAFGAVLGRRLSTSNESPLEEASSAKSTVTGPAVSSSSAVRDTGVVSMPSRLRGAL